MRTVVGRQAFNLRDYTIGDPGENELQQTQPIVVRIDNSLKYCGQLVIVVGL